MKFLVMFACVYSAIQAAMVAAYLVFAKSDLQGFVELSVATIPVFVLLNAVFILLTERLARKEARRVVISETLASMKAYIQKIEEYAEDRNWRAKSRERAYQAAQDVFRGTDFADQFSRIQSAINGADSISALDRPQVVDFLPTKPEWPEIRQLGPTK